MKQPRAIQTRMSMLWLLIIWLAFVSQGKSHAMEVDVFVDGYAQADSRLAKTYRLLPEGVKAVRALRHSGHAERVTSIRLSAQRYPSWGGNDWNTIRLHCL